MAVDRLFAGYVHGPAEQLGMDGEVRRGPWYNYPEYDREQGMDSPDRIVDPFIFDYPLDFPIPHGAEFALPFTPYVRVD